MNLLTKEDLKDLIGIQEGTCVSIFLPTHRAGRDIEQNPIRLKNLLADAEDKLLASDYRKPEAAKFLEPARKLLDDTPFWQNQSDGLALFLTENEFRYYRFPLDFESLAIVGNHFHLKPLLPMLSGDGRFYILALSQNQIRMLQGTHYSVSEIDVDQAPKSLAEFLKYDDPERSIQYHTGTRASSTKVKYKPEFHGQGITNEPEEKVNILRFFHKLDDAVRELLNGEEAPLVLAGVDFLLPIYREANSYPHLMEEGIIGNPDRLNSQELHEKAWKVVQPLFNKKQEESDAKYKQLFGKDSDQTSNEVDEVIPAAYYQRVDTLFVPVNKHLWGSFDPKTKEVEIYEKYQSGAEDLLDLAAAHTLFNGGTVFAIKSEEMPNDEEYVAAIFRY